MASGKIVDYSGSSESEDNNEEEKEENSEKNSLKRKISNCKSDETELNKSKRQRELLPLPDGIKNMFQDKEISVSDDPDLHEGRIRSFPHLAGNWATHVYINVERSDDFVELQTLLLSQLESLVELKPFFDLHISLSKTVSIRHHWIQPLTDSLSAAFLDANRTSCVFCGVKLYRNEEKTRSFLALQVTSGTLRHYISCVDRAFKDFNLPPFYSDPSFHVSIGWCLGDVCDAVPEANMKNLQTQLETYLSENSLVLPVTDIHCQVGNKHFVFPLKSSSSS
ncbi:U6 snRNA phosphodiesterase-like, partial [Argonauta hians]